MDKFDERYIIRLANLSDVDNIMLFLEDYWRKGHIMAHDKELFKYEYVNGDKVNFVLAIDKNTNLLEGIFGFLDCSNTSDCNKKDIWGSMWKVNDTHDNMPFLGIELAKRVFTLTGCRTQIGNGANPNTTIPLRRIFFGDKVTKMKQYYLLNTELDVYNIAIINNKCHTSVADAQKETLLKEFDTIEEVKENFDIESVDAIPYKDSWYVNKRYFCHPYYKYNVYGLIDDSGKVGALMMTRIVECNNSKVLRIVDYIGNQSLFAGLAKHFGTILRDNSYEYIDFFTFGFDEEAIFKAGFVLRTEEDPNVIPNYFEPFYQGNVDIWAHYKYDGTLFFKGDGDQDRPNIMRKIK